MLFARQSSGLETKEEENWGDWSLAAVREWTIAVKGSLRGFCFMWAQKLKQRVFFPVRKARNVVEPPEPRPTQGSGVLVDTYLPIFFQDRVGFDLVPISLPLPCKVLGHCFRASICAQVEQGEMLRLPRVEMCKITPSLPRYSLPSRSTWNLASIIAGLLSWLNSSQRLSPMHSVPSGGAGERIRRVKMSQWAGWERNSAITEIKLK